MTEPQTATIPLPLDVAIHFFGSDGTAGLSLTFRSEQEMLLVREQLKKEIENARQN